MIIVNSSAAGVGIVAAGVAISDGQARNGDSPTGIDVEYTAIGIAIYSQTSRAGT